MKSAAAPGPPATPLTIFGAASVLQWCRADLGVTVATGVSAWADQSGNGRHYAQATGSLQPAKTNADASLNNLPTFTTDGVDDKLSSTITALGAPGAAPVTIFLISKLTSTAGQGGLIGDFPTIYTIGDGKTRSYSGAVVTNASADALVWNRTMAQFSNSALDVFRVGSTSVTGSAGNASSTAVDLGFSSSAGNFVLCKYFEVVYLNKIPSPAEISAYDAYITAITGGIVVV